MFTSYKELSLTAYHECIAKAMASKPIEIRIDGDLCTNA